VHLYMALQLLVFLESNQVQRNQVLAICLLVDITVEQAFKRSICRLLLTNADVTGMDCGGGETTAAS